jgi:hypothetical protein
VKTRKRKAAVDGEAPPEGTAAEAGQELSTELKLHAAVFGEREKLHQVRLACGHLRRIADPGPDHIHKFVKRVFDIVGERGE